MFTLAELRKELRAAGYRLKTRRYSDFIGADILAPDGSEIMTIGVLDQHIERLKAHPDALAIRDKYKGKTFDGDYRVVLT
jgi:hypothetical protein